MNDLEDADCARTLVRSAGLLAEFAAELAAAVKISGAHIINDLLTAERAEPLAERCDEMGRQLRLLAHRRNQPAEPVQDTPS